MVYLWKRIHWPTVEMASWVSLSDESLALRLSSVKAMISPGGLHEYMRQLLKDDAHASRMQSTCRKARDGNRWYVAFSV